MEAFEGSIGSQTRSSTAVLAPQADRSAKGSTAPAMKPLLSRRDLAAYLGMSERATYAITAAPWWPAPLELSPRVLKWRRVEVDAALENAPRRAVTAAEPTQLQHARTLRKVATA